MKLTQYFAGAAALAAFSGAASAQVQFNELFVSHSGTDDMEYIELIGTPGASLDGHMVLVVEGEGGNPEIGTLDRAYDLSGLDIPPSGYFLMGDTGVTPTPDFDLGMSNTLENGANTFYLITTTDVPGVLALLDTDIDSDDDLVTDIATNPANTIIDLIALQDATFDTGCIDPADEFYDGATVIGPDGTPCTAQSVFLPAGIFRDGDSPGAWCTTEFLDFAILAMPNNRTPGTANPSCGGIVTVGTSYCVANDNDTGGPALITATGSASIGANDLVLQCGPVAAGQPGIFFYSDTQSANPMGLPFGEGRRCAVGSLVRLLPPVFPDAVGNLIRPVDYNSLPSGATIIAGNVFNFQGWYRDTGDNNNDGTASGFNLSDGLQITFTP